MSQEELIRELAEKQNQLLLEYTDDTHRRVLDAEYEVLLANELGLRGVQSNRDRRHLVEFYSNCPDGTPVRVVLPEAKFPEAYEAKRRMNWLDDLLLIQRSQ